MKVDHSVTETDIRNIIMSSKYNMLKYHSEEITSLTINNGSSSGEVSISHSLGFVPAFISYLKTSYIDGKDYILPYPGGVYSAIGYDIQVDSYATSSSITLRVVNSTDFGTYQEDATDFYNGFFDSNTSVEVGNDGGTSVSGALRFTNVALTSTDVIESAEVRIYCGVKGAGEGSVNVNTYGIDEDNTSAFSGSPLGRASTTATYQQQHSLTEGAFNGFNVKTIVEEIIARPGWSSGNAMGFKFLDNSSPNDVYTYDGNSGTNSYLRIVKQGSNSFNFRVIIFKDRIDF